MANKNLEQVLKENYYGIVDWNDIITFVIPYIKRKNVISDDKLNFVRKLTKVAHNILDSQRDNLLDGYSERIYAHYLQAIKMFENADNNDYFYKNISHLNSHAGGVCEYIYEKNSRHFFFSKSKGPLFFLF